MEAREWPYVVEYEEMTHRQQMDWDAEAPVDDMLNDFDIKSFEVAKHKCLSCHRFHYGFVQGYFEGISRKCPYCGSELLEVWGEPSTVYLSLNMGTGKCEVEEE